MSTSRRRGTIEARGPDRWLVRVTEGRDHTTGKLRRASQTVTGTRKDAERALTELLRKADQGTALPRGRLTLGEWLEEFHRVWSAGLGPQTRETAQEAIRSWLPPTLRQARLRGLQPRPFQELYNALTARGLSPATVGGLHRVLHSRLEAAVRLGHLAQNPLAQVSPPAVPQREYRVFTPAEAQVFLEEVHRDDHAALWLLLLTTGLRPGEALGLQWPDLQGTQLAVRRALLRLAGGVWQLAETKTRRGRTIPVPAPTLKALQRHRARQSALRLSLGGAYVGHGFIFASGTGEPLWWENLTRRHFTAILARTALRLASLELPAPPAKGSTRAARRAWAQARARVEARALELTGLERMRPYDLRHSAATLLLAAGEHPKVVSELLGHAKITLTLDTYTHVVPGMLDQAARRMEALLEAPPAAADTGR